MLDEYEINKAGKLSKRQNLLLLRWFMYRFLTITLLGFFIASYLTPTEKTAMVTIIIGITLVTTYRYVIDLWSQSPELVTGQITKENIRVRGPVQHYLVFSSGLNIRVSDSVWENIQEGARYKVFYSKHTKWLLSYRPLSE